MNTVCFFDTETTGLPDFKAPSDAPQQPHIVQIGAVLVDVDAGEILSTLDVTIRPDGWTIPDEAAAIHGITTERALAVGVPEELAVRMLWAMCEGRLRVAHNRQFDDRIVRIGMTRHRVALGEQMAEDWKAGSGQCTALLAKPLMQLPPTEKMRAAGFNTFKTPTLAEAVSHFCGREHADAHTALADALGCMDVWMAMRSEDAGLAKRAA
ncbi:MAG: hypothetical protein RIQ53_4018 [Pseudomonadota bacterium]|jgi:DNA polymerase-3 subunit epsilon